MAVIYNLVLSKPPQTRHYHGIVCFSLFSPILQSNKQNRKFPVRDVSDWNTRIGQTHPTLYPPLGRIVVVDLIGSYHTSV